MSTMGKLIHGKECRLHCLHNQGSFRAAGTGKRADIDHLTPRQSSFIISLDKAAPFVPCSPCTENSLARDLHSC